jgi:hypothetical protein
MKKIFYLIVVLMIAKNCFAQIPDPCTGAGAAQAVSTLSPCNCGEAVGGTSCNKSVFTSQAASDAAIGSFLTSQFNYALPTIPTAWQDVRSSAMLLNGTFRHEFSTEFTTGASTTAVAVINICQVKQNCSATCQDYEIFIKASPTCGTNLLTPTLITSAADATLKYRQYTVLPNTTYIVSRKLYFDGSDLDCFLSWTGSDGVSSLGKQVTAQHWFIWSTGSVVLPINNLNFSSRQLNNKVMLQWHTEQNTNFSKFEVEKSTDAINYKNLGEIISVPNTTTEKKYLVEDKSPAAINFYRLKSIDKDGKVAYTPVSKLVLKANNNTSLIIAPNPVKEIANIILESKIANNAAYKIISTMGNVVATGNTQLQKGINKISANVGMFTAGTYLFVSEIDGERVMVKFVKD